MLLLYFAPQAPPATGSGRQHGARRAAELCFIEASDRPGLGLDIDEAVVDRHPLILGASYQ